MKRFIHFIMKEEFNEEVFWEPCGYPDLVATCYGGITRKVVQEFTKSNKVHYFALEIHFSVSICRVMVERWRWV